MNSMSNSNGTDIGTIRAAADLGQAIWLDEISRPMLDAGTIRDLVDAGIRGITTNPTIFDGAIASTDAYDARLASAAQRGGSPEAVFEAIAIADVQDAADLLRPVYDRLGRRDGFVSIEVNPHLANETEGTIAEARRLWTSVDRPNVMIKVPGTAAGVPAIRQLISEGINVNVTLLFSLDAYRSAANAYLDGIAAFVSGGGAPASVSSVASFFVSRVDTLVDSLLPPDSELVGNIGIANAKLAYREYQQLFARDLSDASRFFALNTVGALPQRPLWASTSVKNPDWSPTLYFDNLIGDETVNTLPNASISEVRKHGTVAHTVTSDVDHAQRQVDALATHGVDYVAVTDQLLEEGIQKFADSWDQLMSRVAAKMPAGATSDAGR